MSNPLPFSDFFSSRTGNVSSRTGVAVVVIIVNWRGTIERNKVGAQIMPFIFFIKELNVLSHSLICLELSHMERNEATKIAK